MGEAEKRLAVVTAELAEANSKCVESEKQVVMLTKDLATTKAMLDASKEQQKNTSVRLENLEKEVAENAAWEKKYMAVEKERTQLDAQLSALRSALQALTMSQPSTTATAIPTATVKAKPVTAEVVSDETVPMVEVEPAVAPELPPSYAETTAPATPLPKNNPVSTPLTANDPAATPLALKRRKQLQSLHEMGFSLTLEQLNEKLAAHGGNMQ